MLSQRCFFPGKNKKQSQHLRVKLSALKEFPPEGMLSYVLGFFFFLLVFESASKIHEKQTTTTPPQKKYTYLSALSPPKQQTWLFGFFNVLNGLGISMGI